MYELSETEYEELEQYYKEVETEVMAEVMENNRIHQLVRFHSFVSKSKGRRNGKQRIRRCWKEVDLVSYGKPGFTSWDRFPFDEYAPEIFGRSVPADEAEEHLKEAIPRFARRD